MKIPKANQNQPVACSGPLRDRALSESFASGLMMASLIIGLSACTPKPVEVRPSLPANPFDYSRSDLEGLVEFTNRFGALPDSARLAVCREMDVIEKEGKLDARGLLLHQAAGQIFLSHCSPSPALQEKLKSLLENPDTPSAQKQFVSLAQQLIVRQESQTNALIQAQKKVRTKSTNGAIRRKPNGAEREPASADDPSRQPLPAPVSDDVARKKLEALRNLEKSMDRTMTP